MQARSRGLFPRLVSWPYNTQPWLVSCDQLPLCCITPRCVASEAARTNQTTNCERIQEIARGCKNGHGKKNCVAACCSVLQRVAASCSVLQWVADVLRKI